MSSVSAENDGERESQKGSSVSEAPKASRLGERPRSGPANGSFTTKARENSTKGFCTGRLSEANLGRVCRLTRRDVAILSADGTAVTMARSVSEPSIPMALTP